MRPPLIIGAGPAGVSVALMLRQHGQPAVLLEREPGPADKVCGDFLGAAAIRQAEAFGLDPAALGARPITRLRLIHRARVAQSSLPFRAFGLSRRIFDEALLRRAGEAGAEVVRGQTAVSVHQDGPDLVVRTLPLTERASGTVFLASGRQDLASHPRPRSAGTASALKTYFRLRRRQQAALAGHAELILFHGGYACLMPVEEDRAALCLVQSDSLPWDPWPRLLARVMASCPHLESRLNGALPLRDQPVIATALPLGFVYRPRGLDPDGLFRAGDQAAFLPDLMADGVSIAMRTGTRAAQAWLAGTGAAEYHRKLRAMLWPRMRLGTLLTARLDQPAVAGTPPATVAAALAPRVLGVRWTRLHA